VSCNQKVKFADLLDTAKELGAQAMATGHYVQRVEGVGGAELHAAVDAARDQSYFLFATTQAQLDYLRFPLGGMEKSDVRAIAAELGLVNAAKPDSQDICFVPQGRYTTIVNRLRPDAARPGEIVDVHGAVVGRHDGITNFTVGQRKGLGLSGNDEPLFVLKLDAANARVVVGPRAALGSSVIALRDVNWLGAHTAPFEARVKVRSMRPPVAATVTPLPGGAARVELALPEDAIAPGQACVFYGASGSVEHSRVLGGGWIAQAGSRRRPRRPRRDHPHGRDSRTRRAGRFAAPQPAQMGRLSPLPAGQSRCGRVAAGPVAERPRAGCGA
jgi:tRNA-specific 2-thiouridylase